MGLERRSAYNQQEAPPTGEDSPEVKLLTAILARAIMDLGFAAAREDRRNALCWFRNPETEGVAVTFEFIVDALQISARVLKRIEAAILEAEVLDSLTREIKKQQVTNTSEAAVKRLLRKEWRTRCEENGKPFRQKRWALERVSYRSKA